jgi:nicotinate-nucleotide adenylyltransferase
VELRLDDHAYTVDYLRDERPEDAVFVLGADEWAAFDTWKEPETVLELIPIAVARRPGAPDPAGNVEVFDIDQRPVSSSEIRERLGRGEPVDDLVPTPVAREIERRRLYGRTTGVH